MSLPRKHIKVVSLDYDGCIFYYKDDNDSLELQKITTLLKKNQSLIEDIVTDIKIANYTDLRLMVGSNRQSSDIDNLNADFKGSASAFTALSGIKNKIKELLNLNGVAATVKVDNYLLADTYNSRSKGDTYRWQKYKRFYQDNKDYRGKHHQELYEKETDVKSWFFDDGKLTILYAQIHKLASENPDAEIEYDFYDDRGPSVPARDLLTPLKNIFTQYPELIPPNVKINLYQYSGGKRQLITPGGLSGNSQSQIDYCYEANIIKMVKLAGYNPRSCGTQYSNVLERLRINSQVKTFLKERVMTRDENQKEMMKTSSEISTPQKNNRPLPQFALQAKELLRSQPKLENIQPKIVEKINTKSNVTISHDNNHINKLPQDTIPLSIQLINKIDQQIIKLQAIKFRSLFLKELPEKVLALNYLKAKLLDQRTSQHPKDLYKIIVDWENEVKFKYEPGKGLPARQLTNSQMIAVHRSIYFSPHRQKLTETQKMVVDLKNSLNNS